MHGRDKAVGYAAWGVIFAYQAGIMLVIIGTLSAALTGDVRISDPPEWLFVLYALVLVAWGVFVLCASSRWAGEMRPRGTLMGNAALCWRLTLLSLPVYGAIYWRRLDRAGGGGVRERV